MNLEEEIKKRLEVLSPKIKSENTECFRLSGNGDVSLPISIDVYGDRALVYHYNDNTIQKSKEIEQALVHSTGIEIKDIFHKERKKQKGGSQYEKYGSSKYDFIIREGNARFKVNLSDYLDTGLFLDHRKTRSLVAKMIQGKERLLNLFSYTASFSVISALSGVKYTTSVDMSNTYSEWAKENFKLNHLNEHYHIAIRDNVFFFLENILKKKWRFDGVVIDPPTFSRSKKMLFPFDIQKDYLKLILPCLEILNPGGFILFSTNFSKFKPDWNGLRAKVEDITEKTIPFDFEGRFSHYCYLITEF